MLTVYPHCTVGDAAKLLDANTIKGKKFERVI